MSADSASGRCHAVADGAKSSTRTIAGSRVVFNSTEFPHQAVSAGPRLSVEERNLVRAALVKSGAVEPTAKLRAQWNTPNGFVAAANEEYAGLSGPSQQ